MAWTYYQKFLAVLLVITGSINSLSTKWADNLSSKGSDGTVREFQHPFLQCSFMFIGEILCLVLFKSLLYGYGAQNNAVTNNGLLRGNRNFNPFILMIPAMFDLIATSTMYVGLTLTYVSSFQLFRGSIILFTSLLSVIFLRRIISKKEWLGISLVILGLIVVGIANVLYEDSSRGPNSVLTGNLLIILAQIISASQMVYEEKFVRGLDIPPLQCVGWEGIFGFCILAVLHVVFYYTPAPSFFGNNPRGTVEDFIDGLIQISNNGLLIVSVLGGILSIAFFNFAGISVTKEMSATTRMVLDSVRTIVIWSVSLLVSWEHFHWLILLGFAILICGMLVYNYNISNTNEHQDVTPIINHEADDNPSM